MNQITYTSIKQKIEAGQYITCIARELGICSATIYNHFGTFIKKTRSIHTKKQEKEIIRSYKKHGNTKYVTQELSCSVAAVHKALEKAGIERNRNGYNQRARKHFLNESYFDKIETEHQAYFLGLLYADGCVSVRPGKPGSTIYNINISLKDEDKYLMEELSRVIYGKVLLRRIIYKDGRGADAYRVSINSKHMCESLIKLGCFPRKSLTLKFPTEDQIPLRLMNHFLRGYWDGDGSVGTYNGHKQTSCVCSLSFESKLIKFLLPIAGHKGYCYRPKNKYSTLTWHRKSAIEGIRDYFYKDATIWMTRKKDKFYA